MRAVLDRLRVVPVRTREIPANHGPDGNANWHVWPTAGERCVLRRYYAGATEEDLQYEHTLLTHLQEHGWRVPDPLGLPIEQGGRWYCLTRYVAGGGRTNETPSQGRQRGTDLARLHLALRPLTGRMGQRPGWRPLHEHFPATVCLDWSTGLDALATDHPRLAEWATIAVASTADELADVHAADLPLTVIHGDFLAEGNVHYDRDRFVGVIDFGVSHLSSRPYELISARSYRAPELQAGYEAELRRLGWPWSESEEAALVPLRRAFHLNMMAWQLLLGMRTRRIDTAAIESQLTRTGVDPTGNRHPFT